MVQVIIIKGRKIKTKMNRFWDDDFLVFFVLLFYKYELI